MIDLPKYDDYETIQIMLRLPFAMGDVNGNDEALFSADEIETVLQCAHNLYEQCKAVEAKYKQAQDALLKVAQAFQRGEATFTRKRQSDNDPYHLANIAMWAALNMESVEEQAH